MSKIKIHEEFSTKETSDEWKEHTNTTTYYFDKKQKQLTSSMTRSFHDYRSGSQSSETPIVKTLAISDAPKDVKKKLRELGLLE